MFKLSFDAELNLSLFRLKHKILFADDNEKASWILL